MNEKIKTSFAPMLFIGNGITDISFYERAFGAIEHRRWSNEDGSIHVAEMFIDGAMFHLHEAGPSPGRVSPLTSNGVTTTIGLMVGDVDGIMKKALEAGATEVSPAQDYDYGYRQGELTDPFGHRWIIQKIL